MLSIKKSLILLSFVTVTPLLMSASSQDISNQIKESLVYLKISNSAFEQIQPWKQTDVSEETGFGCAVGPDRILTTAENVMYATYIQARTYAKNESVTARIVTVDYELNLALLELDKESMGTPLKPVTFKEQFPKGKQIAAYWLSAGGDVTISRSNLDRAEVESSNISFAKNITYIVSNTSRAFGDGELCCYNKNIIGLASWGSGSDAGIIPSETINRFLKHCKESTYVGFGSVGFETYNLLDPAMRSYLKLPADLGHGVYVSSVYTMGTGSSQLKTADVIVSIDGQKLNSFGRYRHPQYDLISFHHLILQKSVGQEMTFEIVRDGKALTLNFPAESIQADKMLIPYYVYAKQPQYFVTGGYVFQQLTRDYLTMWGEDWPGKVPPHLFNYYFSESFKPSSERSDIVVLSYVLPAEINLGYQQLSRIVVSTVNGKKISSIRQFVELMEETSESEFHEITFEMEAPVLVIPKAGLRMIDQQIAQIYGITKAKNIN